MAQEEGNTGTTGNPHLHLIPSLLTPSCSARIGSFIIIDNTILRNTLYQGGWCCFQQQHARHHPILWHTTTMSWHLNIISRTLSITLHVAHPHRQTTLPTAHRWRRVGLALRFDHHNFESVRHFEQLDRLFGDDAAIWYEAPRHFEQQDRHYDIWLLTTRRRRQGGCSNMIFSISMKLWTARRLIARRRQWGRCITTILHTATLWPAGSALWYLIAHHSSTAMMRTGHVWGWGWCTLTGTHGGAAQEDAGAFGIRSRLAMTGPMMQEEQTSC